MSPRDRGLRFPPSWLWVLQKIKVVLDLEISKGSSRLISPFYETGREGASVGDNTGFTGVMLLLLLQLLGELQWDVAAAQAWLVKGSRGGG